MYWIRTWRIVTWYHTRVDLCLEGWYPSCCSTSNHLWNWYISVYTSQSCNSGSWLFQIWNLNIKYESFSFDQVSDSYRSIICNFSLLYPPLSCSHKQFIVYFHSYISNQRTWLLIVCLSVGITMGPYLPSWNSNMPWLLLPTVSKEWHGWCTNVELIKFTHLSMHWLFQELSLYIQGVLHIIL